ncbi:MAG: hypothetical protein PHD58_03520 [Anaerolineales bacterium]|nr:hypothetical protein [Anaerolineales bacterium]
MEEDLMVESNWKAKALVVGALVGALVGVGSAYLMIQRAEREDGEMRMGTGEGIKLGLLVLGLLRQVSQLGEGK